MLQYRSSCRLLKFQSELPPYSSSSLSIYYMLYVPVLKQRRMWCLGMLCSYVGNLRKWWCCCQWYEHHFENRNKNMFCIHIGNYLLRILEPKSVDGYATRHACMQSTICGHVEYTEAWICVEESTLAPVADVVESPGKHQASLTSQTAE